MFNLVKPKPDSAKINVDTLSMEELHDELCAYGAVITSCGSLPGKAHVRVNIAGPTSSMKSECVCWAPTVKLAMFNALQDLREVEQKGTQTVMK